MEPILFPLFFSHFHSAFYYIIRFCILWDSLVTVVGHGNANKSPPINIDFLIAGLENKYFFWKNGTIVSS